jgi:hypothetical protein
MEVSDQFHASVALSCAKEIQYPLSTRKVDPRMEICLPLRDTEPSKSKRNVANFLMPPCGINWPMFASQISYVVFLQNRCLCAKTKHSYAKAPRHEYLSVVEVNLHAFLNTRYR